jgi:hypothetical protein
MCLGTMNANDLFDNYCILKWILQKLPEIYADKFIPDFLHPSKDAKVTRITFLYYRMSLHVPIMVLAFQRYMDRPKKKTAFFQEKHMLLIEEFKETNEKLIKSVLHMNVQILNNYMNSFVSSVGMKQDTVLFQAYLHKLAAVYMMHVAPLDILINQKSTIFNDFWFLTIISQMTYETVPEEKEPCIVVSSKLDSVGAALAQPEHLVFITLLYWFRGPFVLLFHHFEQLLQIFRLEMPELSNTAFLEKIISYLYAVGSLSKQSVQCFTRRFKLDASVFKELLALKGQSYQHADGILNILPPLARSLCILIHLQQRSGEKGRENDTFLYPAMPPYHFLDLPCQSTHLFANFSNSFLLRFDFHNVHGRSTSLSRKSCRTRPLSRWHFI